MFTGIDVLLAVRPLTALFSQVPCDVRLSQAASGVTSSYDALLKLFEHLGNFLRRLEIYISAPPTTKMTDIIVEIIIQVLSVLALATKEINAGPIGGRISKCTITYTLHMAQCSIERFGKKMFGDSEIEAALNKIDQLTQEEGRMVGALTYGIVARQNMDRTQSSMIYCG